ncbi:Ig-like domain-containing protein [Catalinimonas niigatensis]|uniref:Ig-like domain-containing protein n=1 Tax=Catalinimonas niigatensis TaxID=1397264 RepID=UPI002664F85E|nr:Ig-like domain-containing protein [Catalinimonas niigatensis]WPP52967.1 Ig-like domain-containing protein [Catalinimonas niigatensis]
MYTLLLKLTGTLIFCLGSIFLQAQHFTITANKESSTCGNQHVTFEAGFIEVGTSYSFNSGNLPDHWASSPYNLGQACTGIFADRADDSDYFWATINDSNGHRLVSTNEEDVRAGGQITFSMRFGRDDPSSGCENPDEPSEGVYLQYSTDGGAHWITFKYWVPHQIGGLSPEGIDLYRWNEFTIAVPEEAKTSNTKFRWFQPSNSGSSYDNWGLDDISVFVLRKAQTYAWDIGDGKTYEEQTLKAHFDSDGLKTVHCTVTDTEGNIYNSAIDFEIIIDNEAPVATANPYFLTLDKDGYASLIADYLDGGSTDNCSELLFSVDKESFSCENLGDNTVTLTVTDNAGNASTITTIVSVYDFTAPLVFTKDIVVQLDEEGEVSITHDQIDQGSTDLCSDTLTFSLDKSQFTKADLGENIVILTVKDESGNETTAQSTVTVEDRTAPRGYTVAFEDALINAEEQSSIAFFLAGAEVASHYSYTISNDHGEKIISGNGVVTSSNQQIRGIDVSSLPDGELRLSLTLRDEAGNSGDASIASTLKDSVAPIVSIASSGTDFTKHIVRVDITFSEPVRDFTMDDIALTHAYPTHLLTDDQQHFTVEIKPAADGPLNVDIEAGVATDEAGNPNQAASNPLSLIFDGTAPGVKISTVQTLVNTAFNLDIDFDEVVVGFDAGDFELVNATLSDLHTDNSQNFTALITPVSDGAVEINIGADVAKDTAGNGNLATTVSLQIMYDATPPEGYAFYNKLNSVNRENVNAFSFTLKGLETGTQLYYSISSAVASTTIEGNLEVRQDQLTLSDLNLSDLADGELTFSFYLMDEAGNQGETIVATTQKATVEIVAIETFSGIEVPFATDFVQLDLPKKIEVTYSSGEKDKLPVKWDGKNFSANEAGVYALEGKIGLKECVNTQHLTAKIEVEVGHNLAPTQIHLSAASFSPDIASEQPIGSFSTQDADDKKHAYALVKGEGDIDNHLFIIIGDELFLTSTKGIYKQSTFSVRVSASDAYTNRIEKVFVLSKTANQGVESINFVNTFSPNGDGINELWIVPDLKFFNNVHIEVFDRSGRSVFQTTDPELGWDGNVRGSILNECYYYIISIQDIQLTKRGVLSVIK